MADDDDTARLQVWLIGREEPLRFDLPGENALDIQRKLVAAFEESAEPIGSVSMPDGTLVRFAAIAATRLTSGKRGGGRAIVLS